MPDQPISGLIELMNTWLQGILSRLLEVRGVRAAGAVAADGRSVEAIAASESFPLEGIGQALRSCADAFHVLDLHRTAPERLRWFFQQGVIHCIGRQGVGVLGAITEHRANQVDSAALERVLLEAYRGLPTASLHSNPSVVLRRA